jgi:hypothetical protein
MPETEAMPEARKTATSEEVWALIREIGEKQKVDKQWLEEYRQENNQRVQENDRRVQENNQRIQENDRKLEEHRQEFDREFKKYREEYDRRMKEQWDKTNKKIGDLTMRFGDVTEHLIAPNLTEKFNGMNFNFTTAGPDRKFYASDSNRTIAEVDILLENTAIVMAVEVKSKLLTSHVQDHIERMDILRGYADEHNDRRVWLGAVGGALMADDARKAAIKAGFYLLEQSGDTVKIAVPEGFKPREWTFRSGGE